MSELERELEAIPAEMAHEVAGFLPSATVEGYTAFLDAMYHYTLQSQGRLERAAAAATDEGLRAFLEELAHDEAQHYRLAEADLRAFGLTPSAQKPASVAAFERAWEELPRDHAAAWVGALLALESVGDHIGPAALPALARLGLGKTQARFVLVHLEADVEHGAKCREHALALARAHGDLVLQGARSAARAWVEMHRCLSSV